MSRSRRSAPVVLSALAVALAVPEPLWAAEGGWETLFSINPGLYIWTVLVFLALLFVLGRFAWKPLLAALDAREKGIQSEIDEAKHQREEAERVLAERQAQLAQGHRQAQAVMAESREAAAKLGKELEAKAREEAQAILDAARREVERERAEAVEVVRREAVDLALAAAQRLLAERLDGDRDRQLVMDYINEISSSGSVSA